MKFTIERNVILMAVQKTLGIVERKTTIPILNNILIEALESSIRVVASDREIGLQSSYPADVEVKGSVTAPAKKLSEMIRELSGETVAFDVTDNNWITVSSGTVVYRVPGLPASEFPDVKYDISDISTILPCDVLGRMIAQTIFAVSSDDMRPVLNGVYVMSPVEGFIEMVATDGHRLSLAKRSIAESAESFIEKGIIIPRKGLSELKKLVEDNIGNVTLSVSRGMLLAHRDAAVLGISLIDGEYPDYKKVIPVDKGIEIELPRMMMLQALRRMSVMSNERFSGVRIKLQEGKIILNSINPGVGEATDEIGIVYSGDVVEVGYNVRYLIDAIEGVDDERISFEMRPGSGPGVVRSLGEDSYLCIIMPIKLRTE
ncbi:MAG: DNA polymerase III subunit beta [Deltaproteobacteria bacterium]|nr:DNA polymerase III subunit beta [Deltaproteobacteria bacterium]